MITMSPYVLTMDRLNRYRQTMHQASLKTPRFPVSAHSFHTLYLKQQSWSINTAMALTKLLEHNQDLLDAALQLDSSKQNSAINSRNAVSSNPAAATVTAQSKAKSDTYSLSISQLATSQTNKGSSLYSNAPSSFAPGHNTFQLTANGKEYSFTFYSSPYDTNKQGLAKMAQTINEQRIGVTAQVVNDQATGKSQLVLTGDKTGTTSGFFLRDAEGNSVEVSGANLIHQQAQDASYKVNGTAYISGSNKVWIGDHKDVEVLLHKTTKESVQINVAPDRDKIIKSVKSFVHAVNNFLSFLGDQATTLAETLYRKWQRLFLSDTRGEALGLTRKTDGSFELDEEKLEAAIEEDFASVEQTLGGTIGIGTKVRREAERLQVSSLGSYSRSSLNQNPYQSYMLPNLFYQQATATGLLFNEAY